MTLDLLTDLDEHIRALVDERVDKRLEELDRSPWMDAKRTAAYLGIGSSRLYKLTAADAIPHYKHEGRLSFNRAEVDAWLSEYRRGPATTATKTDNPEIASVLEEILQHPTRGEAAELRSEANGPKMSRTSEMPRRRSDAPGPDTRKDPSRA